MEIYFLQKNMMLTDLKESIAQNMRALLAYKHVL